MAEIRPFRGIRYDVDRVGDVGCVVAPPYDVIDGALQGTLYDAHPNNLVRIIRGRSGPEDAGSTAPYARAARAYRTWREDGVLRRDREEGIYAYIQDFQVYTPASVARRSRLGVVALVRIKTPGEGRILPHEHTMPGPKADRLELMRHTDAAFGQIFSLYSDPEHRVKSLLQGHLDGDPLFAFDDREGVRHRLWRVTDREAIGEIAALLKEEPLFIADGHHRYETAVAYRDERAAAEGVAPDGRPYAYSMQTLVNMDDVAGMAIYPIHRVVMDLGEGGAAWLLAGLRGLFDMERVRFSHIGEALQALQRRGEGGRLTLGLCTGDASEMHYLTLKPSTDLAVLNREERSEAWQRLCSGLLQMVLGHILELDTETLTRGEKVRFVRSVSEVAALLQEASDRVAFFLNPVDIAHLREVVLAGERMPPKSTFFYPKVYSGLVIQDLETF